MSRYTESVERGLKGLHHVSFGACPGCEECAEDHGFTDMVEFAAAVQTGRVNDQSHFSWSGCGICHSHLGGDRHTWHALLDDGSIGHFDDACTDCLYYIANGDEPEAKR